jgi:cytochrome c6
MIVASYGLADMHKKRPAVNKEETVAAISGEEIYKANNCAVCHGADGKLMLNGAKDLTASTLSRAETEHQILNGKNAMPGYKNSLTPEQLKSLTDYVEGFRNK